MSENIEQLILELALESGNFKKQIQHIDNSIKKTENQFKAAAKGVKDYENTYVGLANKINKTSKQIDLYNQKLNKQETEYKELSNIIATQKQKLLELEATVGKGSAEWQKQLTLVQKNAEKLSKLSNDISKTKANLNSLEVELKESKDAFEKLGIKTKTLDQELEEIGTQLQTTKSEFNLLKSTLNENGNSFKLLGLKMQETSAELLAGVQKIDAYKNQIKILDNTLRENKNSYNQIEQEISQNIQTLEKAKTEYGQNSKEANELRMKLMSLKDSYNSLEQEIEQGQNELNKYQREVNETQADVNRLNRELREMPFANVGERLKSAGGNLKSFGSTMTGSVTMPTIGAGAAAGALAYEYDQGLAKVGSLVNKSGKEMKEYDSTIKEMSKNTGKSLGELTEAMYQGISAGGDLGNIFKLTEVASKTSVAGFTQVDTAIDGLTSTMNAFGITYDDVDKVANKFLLTQNKGKTSVDELSSSIGKVAPTANAAGMGLNELLASTAALTMNGIQTSEAMTATKAALSNIIKPSTEAQKLAKKLGIEFSVQGLKAKGLSGFLKELKEKTGGNVETMGKLFGSTEALNAMLILTGEGAGVFEDVLKDLGGELNLVDDAFKNMTESSGAKMQMAFNELKISLVELGDVIAPIIQFLAEKIQQLSEWFSSLDENQQKNIVTFGLLAAAMGPILSIAGNLFIVGGSVTSMLGKLSAATTSTTGATGGLTGAMGLLASPVGIGLAIGALALLITYLGDNESAILALQEKFGGLGYIIGAVCEFISGVVQLTFGNLLIIIMGICDAIAAIADGPGGQTVNDAWSRMTAKLTLNTEEAMMKVTNSTSRGLSQMRAMSESELTVLTQTADGILKNIPLIVDGNYGEAANRMAHQLGALDQNQLNTLTHMNDTTKMLFQGINNSMTVDQKANQVEWNLKQMAQAGKINGDTMAKDISKAMETFTKTMEQKTKESSNKADTNTNEMSKNVADNTDIMADKVDNNASDMEKYATSNANVMKNNVTSATATMRDRCISDWRSIRNEYSRGINGNVSIMRTTTNVQRSIIETPRSYALEPQNYSLDNRVARAFNIPQIDSSNYMTRGSYYSSSSEESLKVNTSFVNNDFNKIVKALSQKEPESKNEINLYLEKVEIKNNDDYQVVAKKLANMLNVELEKLKKKNKRTKGGGIYA